ncbi:MAG: site-specific DNA-methyltransferase [Lactobacillus iners]|nr:site-specific DNA-methyltransferase [Lactobacillus iners]MCT7842110.1 site-specific DNA-methyltransferase [Lactobacillus iners]
MLEGGQDKDDQKRSEIFYNETIASDEISCMLAPKVFTNAKRYTAVGEKDLTGELDPDTIQVKEETGITFNDNDNLIIKGNNLIALAGLLKRYEGKVKCIYIDPPYNTQNDSFNYNDSFNHSTWLTFMKNRLELARKLLREDGSIFVQCDDNEQAYLKVLMDGIFGRDNFVNCLIWHKKQVVQNDAKFFNESHDYIIVFSLNKTLWKPNLLPRNEEMNARYSNPDNDPRGPWTSVALQAKSGSANSLYDITFPNGVHWKPVDGTFPRLNKASMELAYNEGRIWFGKNGTSVPRLKKYLSEVKQGLTPSTLLLNGETGSTQKGKEELKSILKRNIFSTPKPEALLERILQIGSSTGDLVLDFHLGSGTTAAVAHKMGRRYIGVEQMDYIQDITVERLKKVLEGEQGGISKVQNWHGGGSFVYCELKEDANTLITTIQNATEDTIESVKAAIYADDRIVPYLTKQELADADKDFENLTLEEKKQALIKLVDKNKLYVNASDMDDESYHVSDDDKKFTNSFYKGV